MEGVGEGLFCSSGILARDGLPLGLSEETQSHGIQAQAARKGT